MFTNFVEVSIYKRSTNISNDMTKKLIFAATLLFAGTAAAFAQPKVIAHRGYWTAPNSAQNSLASFSKADSVGAFGSEMDVWLTADDKLIVNHDRIYKGTEIDMEKSTLKEITSIVLPNGENIPTLDAYLRLVAGKPDTRLVLEMKSLSDLKREDLAAEKIVKALRKYNLLDRTDIIAFSINACLAFKKLLPDGRIFYLNGDLSPRSIKGLGLTGHRLLDARAAQAPRMGGTGKKTGTGGERMDGRQGRGHALFHRPGRGLHHDGLPRAVAGFAEINIPGQNMTAAVDHSPPVFIRQHVMRRRRSPRCRARAAGRGKGAGCHCR